MVDIMLGKRAPTGRSPVSWPFQNYTRQIAMSDMGMRHWPGRTHRFLQVRLSVPCCSCTCWMWSSRLRRLARSVMLHADAHSQACPEQLCTSRCKRGTPLLQGPMPPTKA